MTSTSTQRESVRRMLDHIEEHLGEPISMHALAQCAGYSSYHASRVFKDVTGRSPFEYIRLRRLSAAALQLQDGETRVIDVALNFVFDSHEGFTRAFSRQFGLPPSEYRRRRPLVPLFPPAQMRDYYAERQKGGAPMTGVTNTVFIQIIERPARTLVYKPGNKATHYFEYAEEVGCDVIQELEAIPNALHEPMGVWLPDSLRPQGCSEYVQGVEVAQGEPTSVPSGFSTIDLPACKMMVFQGQPFDDDKFEQAIQSLWGVIDSYQPETVGYAWADDDAPRFQLTPMGYRGYIEGRPVRSMR